MAVAGRTLEVLVHQHRQVLGNCVTEDRAEDADIEAPAISHTHHCLGSELISNSHTWSKGFVSVVDIAVGSEGAFAGDPDRTIGQIGKTALIFPVNRLGEVDLPPQAVVEGQLRSDPPCILTIEEETFLPLRCINAGTHVTVKAGYIAQQEGS